MSATDEVWRLQNEDDPECRFFQKIANQGHYRSHKSTRQGIYICTASGKLLGSMNTHDTEAVIRMMQDSLEQFDQLSDVDRKLPEGADLAPQHRWESSYSSVSLDLTMTARDLPTNGNPDETASASWNRDRVWFSAGEARLFLPEDIQALKIGTSWEIHSTLINRIVRFSVIDTARGQTSMYQESEVAKSNIKATVVDMSVGQIKIAFTGTTQAMSPESRGREFPHGIETNLLGKASYDLNSSRFDEFELVAIGTRWGRTVFNGRHNQLDKTPIGFVFQLTADNAPLIAPSFLFAYRADWVKRN